MERNYGYLRLGVIFLPPIVRHPEVSTTVISTILFAEFAPVSFSSFFFFSSLDRNVWYNWIHFVPFFLFYLNKNFQTREIRVLKFSKLK